MFGFDRFPGFKPVPDRNEAKLTREQKLTRIRAALDRIPKIGDYDPNRVPFHVAGNAFQEISGYLVQPGEEKLFDFGSTTVRISRKDDDLVLTTGSRVNYDSTYLKMKFVGEIGSSRQIPVMELVIKTASDGHTPEEKEYWVNRSGVKLRRDFQAPVEERWESFYVHFCRVASFFGDALRDVAERKIR